MRSWYVRPAPRQRFDLVEACRCLVFVLGYLFACLVALAGAAALLFVAFAYAAGFAVGQHSHGHDQFHEHYKSWQNSAGKGCCDNQHCRPLDDRDERTSRGFLEVRIEGTWCPVEPHHFLKRGNVPNASVSHVCAWGAKDIGWEGKGPCERLLCYQGKPGS